jgi:hypothetical protein
MTDKKNVNNIWTVEDEQEHPFSVLEWWAVETFFRSQEDQKQWCLKVALSQWRVKKNNVGSLCNMTLFDQSNNKHYVYYSWVDGSRLQTQKNRFDIRQKDCSMKGAFPTYEMLFFDPQNDIKINFVQHAESSPRWIGQDVTGGWLPMGLGCYRYGIIPKNRVTGTMVRNGNPCKIEGVGYFEHVWGDFDYDHPLGNFASLKKTKATYMKLALWWLSNHQRKLPRSITFSTENNPFGYDWVWAVFDNGWSMFYGNALFWVMDGPAVGILLLTKDGETYTEYADITFHYKKLAYVKEYDFYYPTELELIAKKGRETLHLVCTMTTDPREYTRSLHKSGHWRGLAICEAPGKISGFYDDGVKKTLISGICKIEPQREITAFGHNTLKIDVLLPPQGAGITLHWDSHLLEKHGQICFILAPRPTVRFWCRRINPSMPHTKRGET